jgi:hypothetical protein
VGVEFSLSLGLATAPPAHDAVDGETDEHHDSEGREVDGWTGVCGENRGCEGWDGHGLSSRRG